MLGTVTVSFSKKVKLKDGYLPKNKEEVFARLLEKAKQEYPNKDIEMRDVKSVIISSNPDNNARKYTVTYSGFAKVVELNSSE